MPAKKKPSMRENQQRKLTMQKIAKGGPQMSGVKKPAAPKTQGAAKTLGTIRSLMSPAGAAAVVSAPRPTADGTLTAAMKRGDYKPRQGPAVPKRMTQGGMDKGSFDSAFKASRVAGKKDFTWRGKKYTTKMK